MITASARCICEAHRLHAAAAKDKPEQASSAGHDSCNLDQARAAVCQVLQNAMELTAQPGDLGPLSSCRGIGALRAHESFMSRL